MMEETNETMMEGAAFKGEEKANGRLKAKTRTAVVRQKKAQKQRKKEAKKEKAAKKAGLKYGFDTLNPGQKFTIPHADKKAGKVTVRENVRVLAYEYGKRHGMQFRVEEVEGKKVQVTRVK
jgi:Zn/Cd-binding protein ZinT